MASKFIDTDNRLDQVAKELHKLADGLALGKIQISGVDLTLSDGVVLKVKQKISGTKVVFELKIQGSVVSDDITYGNKRGEKKPAKVKARSYTHKALKKKYAVLWRLITSAIKSGEVLDENVVAELDILSKKYEEAAPLEWVSLWQENELLVNQCITSAQEGDFIQAKILLREIGQAKKMCHKKYK